jgi:hypothetical protein
MADGGATGGETGGARRLGRRALRLLLPFIPEEAETPAEQLARQRLAREARSSGAGGRGGGRPIPLQLGAFPEAGSTAVAPAAVADALGAPPLPPRTGPTESLVGVHGRARPSEWGTIVLADTPGPAGHDEAVFVVVTANAVLPEEGPADGLDGLVAAASDAVAPPYRARAVRREPAVWAVAISEIDVAVLPDGTPGQELVLACHAGERTLHIDDLPVLLGLPELAELGARAAGGPDFVVRAIRLGGDVWEIVVEPL